ncbi:MAG: IclR family transcriptional regulator [Kiritimatiellae bacterium]|nr:IclR family transcriptional regulator [Kiritimatiellia bacterium]
MKKQLVQSVGRAFDILETLGGTEGGLGVTEVARRLRLKIPTTHNLLRTLAARGYAAKDDVTQCYRLGFGCGRLGQAYERALHIPEAARPVIEELACRLSQSVIVAMMTGGELAFVARASGNQMLAVNFEHESKRTGYGSVCGRVILAHLPRLQLEQYIRAHPIKKGESEDLDSRAALDALLERARRDGHLEYWRQNNTVLAIAAPIRDHTGSVVAAVGLGMPGVHFKESERGRLVAAVKEAAGKISSHLGYRETTPNRQ